MPSATSEVLIPPGVAESTTTMFPSRFDVPLIAWESGLTAKRILQVATPLTRSPNFFVEVIVIGAEAKPSLGTSSMIVAP